MTAIPCHSDHPDHPMLRRALAFHHLRRELGRLGEVDEVERNGVGLGQALQVVELAA